MISCDGCRAHGCAGLDEELLDDRGLVRPHPAAFLRSIPWDAFRLWCHVHAVYCYPTTELIEWLRAQGVRPRFKWDHTIEIGAGHGAIARALGIRATDSKVQELDPAVRAYYAMTGQPTIRYPDDVETCAATDAVRRYKPHTVIGAWVTQKWRPGDAVGCDRGIDEDYILDRVERYILIGNVHTPHATKRIMSRPHEIVFPMWLVSRAHERSGDAIWIWRRSTDIRRGS